MSDNSKNSKNGIQVALVIFACIVFLWFVVGNIVYFTAGPESTREYNEVILNPIKDLWSRFSTQPVTTTPVSTPPTELPGESSETHEPRYLVDVAPAYFILEKNLYYQFPSPGYEDGSNSFAMTGSGASGANCSYGFTWGTNGEENYSDHKVNGYKTIKGVLGHVGGLAKTVLEVWWSYDDGANFTCYQTYPLSATMEPIDIELSVIDANIIRFRLRAPLDTISSEYTVYGICNVTIE